MPLQAGSWLMSIFAAFGAAPSNLTVPLTVATVAGSIGVAAGAGAGCSDTLLVDCSVFLFLAACTRQQQSAQCQHADRYHLPTVFLFMMSFFL